MNHRHQPWRALVAATTGALLAACSGPWSETAPVGSSVTGTLAEATCDALTDAPTFQGASVAVSKGSRCELSLPAKDRALTNLGIVAECEEADERVHVVVVLDEDGPRWTHDPEATARLDQPAGCVVA